MSFTHQDRLDYNNHRDNSCHRLSISINKYNAYRRLAGRLHMHYELDANGFKDFSEEIKNNNEIAKIEKRIIELANIDKLDAYFQQDPRGCTLYLDTDLIEDNNYNQSVAIY